MLLIPVWLGEASHPIKDGPYCLVEYQDSRFPIRYDYDTVSIDWHYKITADADFYFWWGYEAHKFISVYEARIDALGVLARDNYPGAALVRTAMEIADEA